MHIVCLYQHYCTPDCAAGGRAYTMLKHLARRHQVTLITSRAESDQRITRQFDWAPPGVTLHMLDVPYANRMTPRERLRSYLEFAGRAFLKGLTVPRPDVIYGISTPLTTAAAAAVLARLRHVPWLFEVRDLWPDFPIEMGAVPYRWLQQPSYALERRLYRSADHVVTVSPDMTAHVRHRGGLSAQRVTTLLQGTDIDLLDAARPEHIRALRDRYGLADRHVVLYAGTFGRANDLPTLIDAARRLADRHDAAFVFMGHGYHEPLLQEAAATHPNVHLLPAQPRHRVFAWFKLAAVSLVSFIDRPVLATNAPSKLFDSLAAGTPVVVTNPGWSKALVEEHSCGWYVPASRPDVLARRIAQALDHPEKRKAAGENGAAMARRHFDRRILAGNLAAIIESVGRKAR